MPNSGEKYAMEAGASGPRPWYQRGSLKVAVQVRLGCPHLLHHCLVGGQLLELLAADHAQEAHRVLAAFLPQSGVEAREKFPGGAVPGPAQIAGQPGQGPDGFGEDCTDRKPADCLHLRHTNGQPPRL